jgi:hypothetical protein
MYTESDRHITGKYATKCITEVYNYKFTTLVSPIKNKTEAFERGKNYAFFPKCI